MYQIRRSERSNYKLYDYQQGRSMEGDPAASHTVTIKRLTYEGSKDPTFSHKRRLKQPTTTQKTSTNKSTTYIEVHFALALLIQGLV